jgi:hypothetical protein
VSAVGVLGAIVNLAFAALTFIHRKRRLIAMAQPLFCQFFQVGGALLCLGNLVTIGENTDFNCMLRPWVFHLPFTMMFGGLFLKVFRIWKIMGNKKLVRVKITNADMLKSMVAMVAIDIAVLVLWTITSPSKQVIVYEKYNDDFDYGRQTCESENEAWGFILGFYKVVTIGVGCYLSFLTRDFNPVFAESRHIFVAIYHIALIGGIAALISATSDEVGTRVTLQSIAIVIGSVGAVVLVMAPKFLSSLDIDPTTGNANTAGNTATSSNATSTNERSGEIDALKQQVREAKAKLSAAS